MRDLPLHSGLKALFKETCFRIVQILKKGYIVEELQALEQAIEITKKYVEKSYVDPSEEVNKIASEIEKTFEISEKQLERIKNILSKSKLKNTKIDVKIDEADKFLLQGLLLKAGVRFTKKLKEVVDFENDKIDFEALLKALEAKKKRAEKVKNS